MPVPFNFPQDVRISMRRQTRLVGGKGVCLVDSVAHFLSLLFNASYPTESPRHTFATRLAWSNFVSLIYNTPSPPPTATIELAVTMRPRCRWHSSHAKISNKSLLRTHRLSSSKPWTRFVATCRAHAHYLFLVKPLGTLFVAT